MSLVFLRIRIHIGLYVRVGLGGKCSGVERRNGDEYTQGLAAEDFIFRHPLLSAARLYTCLLSSRGKAIRATAFSAVARVRE